ncbi:hypothetical protein OG601_20075 [Streptomyces sp. NBC_01239]|uniref:hypothetical protein n=1 Tax=Streptomyces sp. NBC_01239 TaxID=2903792 RepID=UPI00225495B5|nr:hypothetical protein [Streptomyces sp. NBC_01239]MCX4812896.1 hypothetical protein [Streptomyces sp. NBC_01239]
MTDELTRVAVLSDIPAAIDRLVRESGYPEIAEWADYYLNARASDTEALEVFGPLDGRG